MPNHFKIEKREVGQDMPVYLIAEAGVNYENNMATAKEMIDEAAKSGVQAIKFQSYKAGRIASKYSPAYWDQKKEPTKSQHELFTKYDFFGVAEYYDLAKYAKKRDITFLTTCFDDDFVNELDEILPAYKVASADLTNYPLLKLIASKKKPILLSTGASSLAEIHETVQFLKEHNVRNLAILHCVLNYPCPPENANLRAIQTLKTMFPDLAIGYSDHTPPENGMMQLHTAWMLGANILEKHYTLNKSLPGNDHYHSMDPKDINEFWQRQSLIEKMMGSGDVFANRDTESQAITFARRSIVAKVEIKRGQTIKESSIDIKRPGTGIAPKYLPLLIGSKALRDIPEDTILQWNMFIDYSKDK